MSDDELRAELQRSAEEVTNTVSVPRIEDAFDAAFVAVPRNAWLSALAVACAYRAEHLHSADDGEPVTEEWLRAAWIDPPAPLRSEVIVRFGWHGSTGDSSVILYFAGSVVALNPTRGHIRRLCVALGVPLPVAPTAPQPRPATSPTSTTTQPPPTR